MTHKTNVHDVQAGDRQQREAEDGTLGPRSRKPI
jgi:hypothetical protein